MGRPSRRAIWERLPSGKGTRPLPRQLLRPGVRPAARDTRRREGHRGRGRGVPRGSNPGGPLPWGCRVRVLLPIKGRAALGYILRGRKHCSLLATRNESNMLEREASVVILYRLCCGNFYLVHISFFTGTHGRHSGLITLPPAPPPLPAAGLSLAGTSSGL